MKSVLTLNNPLWRTQARRAILDKAVQQSGAQLESLIKQKILTGTKSGRLYRRGAIKRKIAKRDLDFFRSNRRVFKRTFTGLYLEKTTVGYNIHRASAPGESPASDSGALANSVRAKRRGVMSVRVATALAYAAALDNGATINGRSKRTRIAGPFRNRVIRPRPFFAVTVEEFSPVFKQNLREAIAENS